MSIANGIGGITILLDILDVTIEPMNGVCCPTVRAWQAILQSLALKVVSSLHFSKDIRPLRQTCHGIDSGGRNNGI